MALHGDSFQVGLDKRVFGAISDLGIEENAKNGAKEGFSIGIVVFDVVNEVHLEVVVLAVDGMLRWGVEVELDGRVVSKAAIGESYLEFGFLSLGLVCKSCSVSLVGFAQAAVQNREVVVVVAHDLHLV